MPEASVGQSIIIVLESYIFGDASAEHIGSKTIVKRGKNGKERECYHPEDGRAKHRILKGPLASYLRFIGRLHVATVCLLDYPKRHDGPPGLKARQSAARPPE
jgi:hypothetical protein